MLLNQWRINSRRNEEMEPRQKQHPVVDVTGDTSKIWCCKKQYYIGTCNVRSMNRGRLEVVKQDMARVNINILGTSELKRTAAAAKSLQSCLTLCDPIDGSLPGSPFPGILQARTLEWVGTSFTNAGEWKVRVKSLNHVQLFTNPWTAAYQILHPWDFPGKSTGVGCHCLIQNGLE